MHPHYWVFEDQRLTLFCHVQPGARQSQIQGLHDNRIKIQLKSPAVDGKANQALIAFLSKLLKVKQTNISIKSGHKQRKKTVIIDGINNLSEFIDLTSTN